MTFCAVSTQRLSIFLLDRDVSFCHRVQRLLNFSNPHRDLELRFLEEVTLTEHTLKPVIHHQPNLILIDINLFLSDETRTLNLLKQGGYQGKVLVLSAVNEAERVFRVMQAGAQGYLLKEELVSHLGTAIQAVIGGQIYLSPSSMTTFFETFHLYSQRSLQNEYPTPPLPCQQVHITKREQEVLDWLAQGASNEEIATGLYVTVATVKAHLTAIFHKLEVTSRSQAIIKAMKLGLVSTT